jgi:hypothetical protein
MRKKIMKFLPKANATRNKHNHEMSIENHTVVQKLFEGPKDPALDSR